MSQLKKLASTASILSLFTWAPAAHAVPYFDDFENGSLSGWLASTTGGFSQSGVALHNGSHMAQVVHTGSGPCCGGTTSSSGLAHDFDFSAGRVLSFDMHAVATTASGNPSGVQDSGSGVTITFLNAFNIPLASVGLYNYTNPTLLGPTNHLVDSAQHQYKATMASFASLAGLGANAPVAKLDLSFVAWAKFASGGNIYPDVASTARVWFDNVSAGPVASVPEPGTYMVLLPGLLLLVGATKRRRPE